MKKKGLFTTILAMSLLIGCGKDNIPNKEYNQDSTEKNTGANVESTDKSANETTAPTEPDLSGIEEAIRQETSEIELITSAEESSDSTERIPSASISEIIPAKYTTLQLEEAGTLEQITYSTYDYFGDESPIEKHANVYLPSGYDSSKQYNVLYLMHGIGGDENEWGMTNAYSKVKIIMDNLAYFHDTEPFIIVTPNGRSSAQYEKEGSDFNSFYCFGKELRNDLIPYIESHYATYAPQDKSDYHLEDIRDHRAMAGLSMGGMQTINIGIHECIDLFGYFGAFSAAPTSYPKEQTADFLSNSNYDVRFFYNICGLQDNIAYQSASSAAKNLPALCDKLVDGENFMWQELNGAHDFNIWYLGFYNFAQLVFR